MKYVSDNLFQASLVPEDGNKDDLQNSRAIFFFDVSIIRRDWKLQCLIHSASIFSILKPVHACFLLPVFHTGPNWAPFSYPLLSVSWSLLLSPAYLTEQFPCPTHSNPKDGCNIVSAYRTIWYHIPEDVSQHYENLRT